MRQLLLTAALGLCACTEGFHSVGFFDRVDTMNAAGKNVVLLGTGDLDGDGRADVILVDSANNANEVSVLFSKGDGNFSAGVSYPLDNSSQNHTLVVGDLNGDGRADVIVGNLDQSLFQVFMNQGDGRLMALPQTTPTSNNCKPALLVLYDMTGDGKPDLVVGCSQANLIQVYKNQGASNGQPLSFGGMYSHKWTTATSQAGSQDPAAVGIAIGELNGDGIPDIAVATATDLRILNSPRENVTDYQVSVPLTASTTAVALGDVNGNGITDISALQENKSVQVFEYATGGAYSLVAAYQNLGGVNNRYTTPMLKVADFSSDGKSDFLVSLYNPSELKVAVSRGETGMVAAPVTLSYQYPVAGDLQICDTCLSLGDVNGDSRPDLVLRNGGKISVLINGSR